MPALALLLILPWLPPPPAGPRAQQPPATKQQKGERYEHARYQIKLDLDFDARAFAGAERVRWTNRDDSPASALYFHLYPNARAVSMMVTERMRSPRAMRSTTSMPETTRPKTV